MGPKMLCVCVGWPWRSPYHSDQMFDVILMHVAAKVMANSLYSTATCIGGRGLQL